jgi:predicted dehydrogenase
VKISPKIRFGVIGCSRVAQKGMLPALRDSEYAELAMVGSRNPEKAKEVALQFSGNEWGTYDDVLKNENIDAVYVSLPNALHEEWAIKAIEAGKHVICEKPAAISYAAAKRMVACAQKKNVRLLDGLMFQYHPQHARVKSLIDSGVLGELIRFDGCFGCAMPERASNAMNEKLGGGSFNDQATYPICASRMIFGEEPESVLCKIQLDSQSRVSIKSDTVLYYSDNKIAFASSIFGSYYQSTYSVLGSKAHVRMGRAYAVPRDRETKLFLDADDFITEITIEPADHFKLMVDDFCIEIAKGIKSAKKYEENLLAQARVLEAMKKSHAETRIVHISEIV